MGTRTGGMTAIGILNIVLGSIFSLLGLLAVVAGGAVATLSSAANDGTAEGEQAGAIVAAGGGFLALIGIAMLVFNVLLIAAGVGVLKVANWGRILSMVCGAVIAILQMVNIVFSGFGVMNLGLFIYGMCLVGLFMQPAWREAFTGGSSLESLPTTGSAEDRFRRAA